MPTLKDIVEAPERLHEDNDCAVVAVANVLDIPYAEAHALLKQKGRRNRCGTRVSITLAALNSKATIKQRGIPINFSASFRRRANIPTVAQFLRALPKSGRFLLASTTHAFAYVDGVLKDNIEGGKMRARMARCYEVEIKMEPKPEIAQADINAMWERLNKIEL